MAELLQNEEVQYLIQNIPFAIWETVYSTVLSTIFAYILGLPLGVILVVCGEGGIRPWPRPVMSVLNLVTNLLRSVPFLILMVIVFPLSRLILGTSIGTVATIVPLTVAAFPFVARLVEGSLREMDPGLVEAAQSMGCSTFQIIWKVMLPECRPSLITGATTAFITILSYGAMAGSIGGGGLGSMVLNRGWTRHMFIVLYGAVIVLVVLVQIFQTIGTGMSVKMDHRVTDRGKRRAKKSR